MIKEPNEEVEVLRQTAQFYKNSPPRKVPQYFLHTLKSVTLDGLWLEFGVWTGTSINLIAKIMRHLRLSKKPIYGFDSFEGLPEDWAHPETGEIQAEGKKGHFTMGGNFPAKESDNIVFVKGWFDETLPNFVEQHPGPVALLHIDSDLYSSAKTIFDNLADRIVPGTVIMFDEFYNYDGFEAHEYKAFKEFVEKYNVTYKWITHVYDGRQASLVIESIEV